MKCVPIREALASLIENVPVPLFLKRYFGWYLWLGLYAAGVVGAPVTRWQLYDTHYTERYLGNPLIDPKSYETSNALADAVRIHEPFLLLHGMSDDNVIFQNSSMLADELCRRLTRQ